MAIHRNVPHHLHPGQKKDVTVPSFSFPPNDDLAQVILDAWANKPWPNAGDPKLGDALLDRDKQGAQTKLAYDTATARMKTAKFDLQRAVVITEEEHDNDYYQRFDNEVVFVLPRPDREDLNGTHLLETAKLLMACTPNGI